MSHLRTRREERGYSLLIAIVVLVFLSALAAITVKLVTNETHVAGNDRASHQALYLAQAGIAWGTDVLRQPPFNLNGAATIDEVLANTTLRTVTTVGDVFYDAEKPWLELPGSPVTYLGGTFRVAISDDKDDGVPTTDSNGMFLMRALGTDSGGSRRLVEVVLSVPTP